MTVSLVYKLHLDVGQNGDIHVLSSADGSYLRHGSCLLAEVGYGQLRVTTGSVLSDPILLRPPSSATVARSHRRGKTELNSRRCQTVFSGMEGGK